MGGGLSRQMADSQSEELRPFLRVGRAGNVSKREQESVEECLILMMLKSHFSKNLSLSQAEKLYRSQSSSSFTSLASERICCNAQFWRSALRDFTAGTSSWLVETPPTFPPLGHKLVFCALLNMWKVQELFCSLL